MALTDPQTIDIGGSDFDLPRISTREFGSTYANDDGTVKLSIDHAYGRRTRQVLRVDHSKISADEFLPEQNREVGMSFYIVTDRPARGFSNAEALAVGAGLMTIALASGGALYQDILEGQS